MGIFKGRSKRFNRKDCKLKFKIVTVKPGALNHDELTDQELDSILSLASIRGAETVLGKDKADLTFIVKPEDIIKRMPYLASKLAFEVKVVRND